MASKGNGTLLDARLSLMLRGKDRGRLDRHAARLQLSLGAVARIAILRGLDEFEANPAAVLLARPKVLA